MRMTRAISLRITFKILWSGRDVTLASGDLIFRMVLYRNRKLMSFAVTRPVGGIVVTNNITAVHVCQNSFVNLISLFRQLQKSRPSSGACSHFRGGLLLWKK